MLKYNYKLSDKEKPALIGGFLFYRGLDISVGFVAPVSYRTKTKRAPSSNQPSMYCE